MCGAAYSCIEYRSVMPGGSAAGPCKSAEGAGISDHTQTHPGACRLGIKLEFRDNVVGVMFGVMVK